MLGISSTSGSGSKLEVLVHCWAYAYHHTHGCIDGGGIRAVRKCGDFKDGQVAENSVVPVWDLYYRYNFTARVEIMYPMMCNFARRDEILFC